MKRGLFLATTALLLLLIANAGFAGSQPDYSDLGFDDFKAVISFVTELKRAVAADDKKAVAALVSYPLYVTVNGEDKEFADAAAFLAAYDTLITPYVKAGVASQGLKPEDIFINRQGLLIGDGMQIIAMSEPAGVRISSIQPSE